MLDFTKLNLISRFYLIGTIIFAAFIVADSEIKLYQSQFKITKYENILWELGINDRDIKDGLRIIRNYNDNESAFLVVRNEEVNR